MLRFIGALLLMAGSIGIGWSMRIGLKENLEHLYQMRQIFWMLQKEIEYSKAPLPEACRKIGDKVEEPYRGAFLAIREEMIANYGTDFPTLWKRQMEKCMKEVPVAAEDKRIFLAFGNCIGYMDGAVQAQAVEQYIHKLERAIERQEKNIADKCKVIMSLSIMGGLMLVVILL